MIATTKSITMYSEKKTNRILKLNYVLPSNTRFLPLPLPATTLTGNILWTLDGVSSISGNGA